MAKGGFARRFLPDIVRRDLRERNGELAKTAVPVFGHEALRLPVNLTQR